MISMFHTFISPEAEARVCETLRSGFLSEGKLVQEFEHRLSTDLGLQNPVAVNSGSTALLLALVLAGVKPGDEVICPAQTFVATALAVMHLQARPVFCDIEFDTGNLSTIDLERRITNRTRAIMPVHWAGFPCDMDRINEIAKRHDLVVVEDAAHALGASYRGRPVGSLSDFACFSFQAIKHLTTGDGGAISCSSSEKHKEAMTRRWFGIDRQNSQPSILGERSYDLSLLGFKYHMNDLAAALGLANLTGFYERLKQRRAFADFYRAQLKNISGLRLFRQDKEIESSYWLFPLHVERREDFVRALAAKGVAASVVHQRIDRNSIFGGERADLPIQSTFDQSQINIPIHDGVDQASAEQIVAAIKSGW